MLKRGFTLIEVMASLLVFAIGGTMALSVFNFNATARVSLKERMEANLIAHNLLQTLILKSKTDTDPPTGWRKDFLIDQFDPVGPADDGDEVWFNLTLPDRRINIQQWVKDAGPVALPDRRAVKEYGCSANDPRASDEIDESITPYTSDSSNFEWRFSITKNPVYKIRRYEVCYTEYEDPDEVDLDVTNDIYLLRVEVSWPKTILPITCTDRKRVTIYTIIS